MSPGAVSLVCIVAMLLAGCDEPARPLDEGPAAGAVVAVHKSGDGRGTIASDPEGIACEGACAQQELALTVETATLTLTAAPARDALFESWTCVTTRGGTSESPRVSRQLAVVAFDEPDAAKLTQLVVECTARFRQLHTLVIVRSGEGEGDVTGSLLAGQGGGSRIDCGDQCTAGYFANEEETLTALPAAGSLFSGWSFDCEPAEPSTVTVLLDADKNCEARFELE